MAPPTRTSSRSAPITLPEEARSQPTGTSESRTTGITTGPQATTASSAPSQSAPAHSAEVAALIAGFESRIRGLETSLQEAFQNQQRATDAQGPRGPTETEQRIAFTVSSNPREHMLRGFLDAMKPDLLPRDNLVGDPATWNVDPDAMPAQINTIAGTNLPIGMPSMYPPTDDDNPFTQADSIVRAAKAIVATIPPESKRARTDNVVLLLTHIDAIRGCANSVIQSQTQALSTVPPNLALWSLTTVTANINAATTVLHAIHRMTGGLLENATFRSQFLRTHGAIWKFFSHRLDQQPTFSDPTRTMTSLRTKHQWFLCVATALTAAIDNMLNDMHSFDPSREPPREKTDQGNKGTP